MYLDVTGSTTEETDLVPSCFVRLELGPADWLLKGGRKGEELGNISV